MSGNTFDIDSVRQIDALAKLVCGLPECKRLGFVVEDERGVMCLTAPGLGYLLFVEARGVTSIAEAFAAGFECGYDAIDAEH